MKNVVMKKDTDRIAKIDATNPSKRNRGHLILTGDGVHSDKRLRRSTRKSRNERSIAEYS